MKPNTKYIFVINFNNAKWNDFRLTQDWIDHRMHIFMNYTFKSICNQTKTLKQLFSTMFYPKQQF